MVLTWIQNRKLKTKANKNKQEIYIYIYMYIYIYDFEVFSVFGRFSAKVGPRRVPNGPGLEKRHRKQRTLAREIDSKAPRNLKSKFWP